MRRIWLLSLSPLFAWGAIYEMGLGTRYQVVRLASFLLFSLAATTSCTTNIALLSLNFIIPKIPIHKHFSMSAHNSPSFFDLLCPSCSFPEVFSTFNFPERKFSREPNRLMKNPFLLENALISIIRLFIFVIFYWGFFKLLDRQNFRFPKIQYKLNFLISCAPFCVQHLEFGKFDDFTSDSNSVMQKNPENTFSKKYRF